jgi:predicted DNA-binding transcriptional regulator YafY
VRTVRRDVERLRDLGYMIDSTIGMVGGYSLGVGGRALPPLMLAEDEAVATALCLRAAASDSVAGVGEAASRALAKLEQTLPRASRAQVAAVSGATIRVPSHGDEVDPEILVTVSRACRERDVLRVLYRNHEGHESERRLQPYRVVSIGRRWYLVARRERSTEWRTFRVDRIVSATDTGHRFEIDEPPDAAAVVRNAISVAPYAYRARIEFGAPFDTVAALVPSSAGVVEMIDESTTLLVTGGDALDWIAFHLAMMRLPFRVLDPPELVDTLRDLAAHLLAAGEEARRQDFS